MDANHIRAQKDFYVLQDAAGILPQSASFRVLFSLDFPAAAVFGIKLKVTLYDSELFCVVSKVFG